MTSRRSNREADRETCFRIVRSNERTNRLKLTIDPSKTRTDITCLN